MATQFRIEVLRLRLRLSSVLRSTYQSTYYGSAAIRHSLSTLSSLLMPGLPFILDGTRAGTTVLTRDGRMLLLQCGLAALTGHMCTPHSSSRVALFCLVQAVCPHWEHPAVSSHLHPAPPCALHREAHRAASQFRILHRLCTRNPQRPVLGRTRVMSNRTARTLNVLTVCHHEEQRA